MLDFWISDKILSPGEFTFVFGLLCLFEELPAQ